MNEYLHLFVVARNRASAVLGELALVIPRCRTSQFSRSLLPAAAHLFNLLPSGVLSGVTLSSFNSTMKLCLLRAYFYFFRSLFPSLFIIL